MDAKAIEFVESVLKFVMYASPALTRIRRRRERRHGRNRRRRAAVVLNFASPVPAAAGQRFIELPNGLCIADRRHGERRRAA